MTLLSAMLFAGAAFNCTPTLAGGNETITLLTQAQEGLCQSVSERFDSTSLTLLSTSNVSDATLASTATAAIDIGQPRAGRIPVTLSWPNANGMRQRAVLWFRINGRGAAWRFRRDLSPGQVLTVQDVEQAVVDLAVHDLERNQTAQTPVGMAIVKSVREGEVVLRHTLREPALVARNSRVRVVVGQRGLRVVTHGVALTTGWNLSDAVHVALADSEQTVLAKVAGEDEVYVEI